MKGRMLASVVMTAIGASLLAAAMFASTASGTPKGQYTIHWNSMSTTLDYNHNYANNMEVGALLIQSAFGTGGVNLSSADFDNIIFVPESAGALAVVTAGFTLLIRRRIRSS